VAANKYRIKILARYSLEARRFLLFLQNVANKSGKHARIKSHYIGRGVFDIEVEDKNPGLDSLFLLELILNRGLYYYSCTLQNKNEIVTNVILPIFRKLLEERFANPQLRFLRKHILGKHSQSDFIPVDLKSKAGAQFEVLYRKWYLDILSIKDYVIELDTFIHQYVLETLGHKPGEKSDSLPKLVQRINLPFELHEDVKNAFLSVHGLRTGAVHRLQLPESKDDLDYASLCIYNFYSLIDDLKESNNKNSLISRGKKYKRFKYGEDGWSGPMASGKPSDWGKFTSDNPCHDCFVKKGNYHVSGCDVERCPKCGHQLISCNCKFNY